MERYIIQFKPDAKVLELGGGTHPIVRPNADVRKLDTVDIVCDFNKPLPMESDSYDMIISLYCLEHISWRNLKQVISELYRILKPNGGKIVALVPNTLEQCKKAVKEGVNPITIETLFGAQNYEENAHACGFSPEYAKQIFEEVGFTNVQIFAPMPDVVYGNYVVYPNCVTDMVIQAEKTGGKPAEKPGLEVQIT